MITANIQTNGGWLNGVLFPDYDDAQVLWEELCLNPQNIRIQREAGRNVRLTVRVANCNALEVHKVDPIVQEVPEEVTIIDKAGNVSIAEEPPEPATKLTANSEWAALEQEEATEGEEKNDEEEPD